jgi:aspartate/methionine/tyrosine aminotransferase
VRLNPSVQHLDNALSITINQIVYNMKRKGQRILTLSLGEGFFEVPLFDFAELDSHSIFHYSDTQGLPGLRKKIADHYNLFYKASVSPDLMTVTAGSKAAIFFACMALLDKGDEALLMEPAWLSYPAHVEMAKAKPVYVPYDVNIDELESYFTDRTRLLIACNPNNPGGFLYSKEDLQRIYTICLKHDVFFLMDEAYSDFVLDDQFVSLATVANGMKNAIVINSFSKNFGMSGWRLGYAITDPLLVPTFVKLNQHIITCAPTILAQYVEHNFDKLVENSLPQVKNLVKKRATIQKEMKSLEIEHMAGSSTFYFFLSLGNFQGTSTEFALNLLLKHNISVVPGSVYGKSTGGFVRISIGTETIEDIVKGLKTIKQLQETNYDTRDELIDLVKISDYIGKADSDYFVTLLETSPVLTGGSRF